MRFMRTPIRCWIALTAVLPVLVQADRVLFAQRVSYCSPNRAIEVEKFLLSYDDTQQSISLDVSAASVDPNLQAILAVEVIAYGMDVINTSINLCEELFGLLCPLPTYNFVAAATLPLPEPVRGSIDLPGIAFIIPDLEARATVRLIRVDTGIEAACLTVDLSNGKSVRFKGISWALGGLVMGAALLGVLRAIVSFLKRDSSLERGRGKERFLLIFSFYQFVAMTGLISLDYPNLYTSFTANFAWALGLIWIRPFQHQIDQFRNSTGGNLTQVAGQLVGGTEAESMPNFVSNLALTANSPPPPSPVAVSYANQILTSLASHANNATSLVKRQAEMAGEMTSEVTNAIVVPDVEEQDTLNTVSTGIPRYLTNLYIAPYNGFMTVFLTFLLFLAVFLAVLILVAIPYFLLKRRANKKKAGVQNSYFNRENSLSLVRANAFRVLLVCWFPLTLFAFFQWTLGTSDAYGPIVLSVFTFITTTAAVLFLAATTFISFRRQKHQEIFTIPKGGSGSTPFWNQYKPSCWWFYIPVLSAVFLEALFVAFARKSGWTTSVALVVIEFCLFIAMCVFTPWNDKSSNGVHIGIQVLKCLILAALISFNRSISLNEIARTAVGAVLAVVESVVVIFFFLLLLIDFVSLIRLIFRKRDPNFARDEDAPEMEQASYPANGGENYNYGAYGNGAEPIGSSRFIGQEGRNPSPESSTVAGSTHAMEGKPVDMSNRATEAQI